MTTIDEQIEAGKGLLRRLGDGEISPSVYDTAWVARIPDGETATKPMFPQCLRWLEAQQSEEGWWGYETVVHYHDRLLNTLSAIIALAQWQVAPERVAKGSAYIDTHLEDLSQDKEATFGFEILFSSLIATARKVGIELAYGSEFLQMLVARGEHQVTKLLSEEMYRVPGKWLYVLEGFEGYIDYERMLPYQSENGAWMNSPAATASIYLHTLNEKAVTYLESLLEKFDSWVPVLYPIDILERVQVLNDIHYLDLQHYFSEEIEAHLNYIEANWSHECGLSISRTVSLTDVGNTATGFQLLRLNGRNAGANDTSFTVSADVFAHFYDGEQFSSYAGDSGIEIAELVALWEATQTSFWGESILETAEKFACKKLLDERLWALDSGEIGAAEVANLVTQRRFFVPPYVERQKRVAFYAKKVTHRRRMGKVIYHLPCVHSPLFLKLAQQEGKMASSLLQQELVALQAWGEAYLADVHAIRIPSTFFLGYNTVWEITPLKHRTYFTYLAMWLFGIDGPYDDPTITLPEIEATTAILKGVDVDGIEALTPEQKELVQKLYAITDEFLAEVTEDESDPLWQHFISLINRTIDAHAQEAATKYEVSDPTYDGYLESGRLSIGIGSTLQATYCGMGGVSPAMLENPRYAYLLDAPSDIGRILNDIRSYKKELEEGKINLVGIVMKQEGVDSKTAADILYQDYERRMKELYQFVVEPQTGLPTKYKMAAFNLCRTLAWFYLEFDFNKYAPTIFYAHQATL